MQERVFVRLLRMFSPVTSPSAFGERIIQNSLRTNNIELPMFKVRIALVLHLFKILESDFCINFSVPF